MSFQSFLNDPKGYLRIHEMELQGQGYFLTPASVTRHAPVANAAHGTSIRHTHIANVTMTQNQHVGGTGVGRLALGQVGLMNKRRVVYVAAVGGLDPGLRILPWSGTDVTFMELDGASTFAMTGPLTGCTVAIVRHGGTMWFFHANVAGGGGMGPGNRATKRMMIRNAGMIVAVPPTANYHFCQFGPTHEYNGLGFVWGRLRPNGNWKFYVHWIRPPNSFLNVNATIDGKWAEL